MFELTASRVVPALKATVETYLHAGSGARHIHVRCDDEEKVFLVGFPTMPTIGDGRAHILEHLALCGSQRYPVADPFFAMMRRSTATFMNAMTYADRTAYPFASTNEADFFNLLDVYLDATFYPKLERLSFLQEGWRHTLTGGKLGLQGVVFNEMKGSYADPTRSLSLALQRELLAGTTYAVDSGGDPLLIPSLDYEELKRFHASHYHPGHAIFMTWGRVNVEALQDRIAERVLTHWPAAEPLAAMHNAATWAAPRSVEIAVPSQGEQASEFGAQIAWRLGQRGDLASHLRGQLLSIALLGDASAPLMSALQSAGFGRPAPLLGLDPQARELLFHAGMAGLTESQVPAAMDCMREALSAVAEQGVPADTLSAILRDMRYRQREVPGGQYPAGLVRLLTALPLAMDGTDVLSAFDIEHGLQELEQDAATPAGFARLVQQLLASSACLSATVRPDANFHARRKEQEQAWLAQCESALSESDRLRIRADEGALAESQNRGQDLSVLPRIRPQDVGDSPRVLPVLKEVGDGHLVADIASNGITYGTVVLDVSHITPADWPWLSLYAQLLPELGAAGRSYTEASQWRQMQVSSHSVHLDAFIALKGDFKLQLVHTASALEESQAGIATVLRAWIETPVFGDHERLGFLIRSHVNRLLSSLAQQGSSLAILAASAPLSPAKRFEDVSWGAGSVPHHAELRRLIATPDGVAQTVARLSALHSQVLASTSTMVCGGSAERAQLVQADLRAAMPGLPREARPVGASEPIARTLPAAAVALHLPSPVNHCSAAWAVPRMGHADAPALAVAASFISQQLLHRMVREQGGAYGGSASYDAETGVFAMNSFRDPRLAATYADFTASLLQIQQAEFASEAVEEAIVTVVKGLDKPGSPQGDLWTALRLRQRGVSHELRRQYRMGVLQCSLHDVQRVARDWLASVPPSRAAAAGALDQDLAGLAVIDLQALAR